MAPGTLVQRHLASRYSPFDETLGESMAQYVRGKKTFQREAAKYHILRNRGVTAYRAEVKRG